MITKAKSLMILATATCIVVPATARAQVNPALIGEGAMFWGNNCGRCHNVRPATERSDAEWAIIVMQMRARANLTGQQAAAVLAYLQATNTAEGSPGGAAAVETSQEKDPSGPREGAARDATSGSGAPSLANQGVDEAEGVRRRH